MPLVLRTALVLLFVAVGEVLAQSRVYLLPDIGTPGRNTYVEMVAQVGSGIQSFPIFDGFVTTTSLVIEPVNAADNNRIIISPAVMSWGSRHIGFQIFVKPNAALGPVPLRLRYPSNPTSPVPPLDTFFIVAPTHIGVHSGGGALGSGGLLGRRSKRGAMIVDSLILSGGTYTVDPTYDPDLTATGAGNQGYLPTVIISLGRVSVTSATLSVSANGKDGGPGGGSGGGYGPNRPASPAVVGEREAMGNGYAGGYSNVSGGASPGPFGIGSGAGSAALNGVIATNIYSTSARITAGAPGHPFDEDGRSGGGTAVGGTPTTFGFYQGGGGNATAGTGLPGAAPAALNGQPIGNAMIVPIHGGAGGAGGGSYDSVGGGGGGGLSIHTWMSAQIDAVESNGARGRDGFNGPAGSGDPSGGGAGGSIIVGARLLSRVTAVNLAGGVGGSPAPSANPLSAAGTGSAGRFRLDGRVTGVPTISTGATNYAGPTMDTITFADSVNWRLRGTGRPGDEITVYQRGDEFNWNYYSSYTTTVGSDSVWQVNVQFPYDTIAYLFALQKVSSPGGARAEMRPPYIFSQSAASIVRLRLIAKMQAPTLRSLDTIRCGTGLLDTFNVSNTGTGLLILRGTSGFIGPNASRYTISNPTSFPDTIYPGQRRTIRIVVPPNAPEGNLSDTLRLYTTDPTDSVHNIVVRLYKETESHTIGPLKINMGSVYLGTAADTVIRFLNNNTYIDSIYAIDRVFGPASITYRTPPLVIRVQGRDSVKLGFRFVPIDTLTVTTRYVVRTMPCNKIDTIEITGRGVTGIINSRKRLDFPTIACGDTATDSVWIKNTGNAPLTVHAPTVIGSDQARYTVLSPPSTDYPKVLRPFLDSFLVRVRVVAMGSGLLSAQLRFENSDSIRLPRPENPWFVDLGVEPDRAVLRLSDTVLEMGTLCLGGFIERSVKMDNPSLTAPIQLPTFTRRVNSTAFVVTPTSRLVGPGAQEEINVRYQPLTAGEFYDTIDIVTTPCERPFRVRLHGTAINAALVATPASVDFGDVKGGTPQQETFVLRNSSSTDPLQISGLVLSPANSQVRIVWPTIPPSRSIAPGDTMRVIVEYVPSGTSPLPAMGVKAIVSSPCNDTATVALTGRPLKGSLGRTVIRPFVSSPCNSDPILQQMRVYNTGSTPITVQSPTATPAVFSVVSPLAAFVLQPGDTQTITLRYTPGAVGTINGTLTILSNDPENAKIEDILTGTRDTALIQPRDRFIRFTKVAHCAIGDTVTLVLSNNGSVNDTVISVSCPAPFEAYPSPPYFLRPGDTVALRLVFRALVPGTYSEQLTYRTTVCNQEYTVQMDGEKVDSAFTVDPIDFGDVQVGNNGSAGTNVTNLSTLGVRVRGAVVNPPNPDITVTTPFPFDIGPGGTGAVNLQFAPTAAGSIPAGTTLQILIDSVCPAVLNVSTSGRGIEGGIAFDGQFNGGTVLFCRDTVDSVVVRNIGQYPVTLNPPAVNPAASTAFFTVTNAASYPVLLTPGDSAQVVIHFTPGAGVPGPIAGTVDFTTDDPQNPSASLVIGGVRGEQQIGIAGTGVPPTGVGFVGSGSHWLVNTGNAPIVVNGVTVGAPFTVTSTLPATPTTLQPGDSLLVNFDFAPQSAGMFNDSLVIVSADVPCGINAQAISGEGIDMSVITGQGEWVSSQGAPGQIVRIPLRLMTDMGALDIRKFVASVRFNPTVLVPLRILLDSSIVPGWQVTGTDFDRGQATFTCEGTTPLDSTGVLAQFEALVALGDSTVSAITPGDTLSLVSPRALFRVAAGQFTLLSSCTVGGERLVQVGEGLKIAAVRPDPVRDIAEIEFHTVESGRTSLHIYDALGRAVSTLVSEDLQPNSYVVAFSGRELPSGVYYLELRSPTQRERRQVIIGR